jgi:hypothetical protein
MTNVVVVKQKKIVVTNNANTQEGIDYTRPITVKQTIGYTAQNFRLDHLNDVVEGNPAAGDTLVYNSNNDTYEVKKLALSEINIDVPIVTDLDGGSF